MERHRGDRDRERDRDRDRNFNHHQQRRHYRLSDAPSVDRRRSPSNFSFRSIDSPPRDSGTFHPPPGSDAIFNPPGGAPTGGFWPMGGDVGGGFGNEFMGPPRPMMPPQSRAQLQQQPPLLSGQKRGSPFSAPAGSPGLPNSRTALRSLQFFTDDIRATMAPGSTTQRLDSLEERVAEISSKVEGVEASISEIVTRAVASSMEEWRKTVEEQLAKTYEENHRGLEGRLNQHQENQDQRFKTLKETQENFFAEMREMMVTTKGFEEASAARLGQGTKLVGERQGFEGRGNHKFRKLEMATFSGLDPDDWILRGEQYFEFQQLMEFEKLQAAVVAMEGDALRWYRWENRRRPVVSWDDLKRRVLVRFRPSTTVSLHEQWLSIRHTTTVAEYRRLFLDKAAPLKDVPESVMKGQFINGLEETLRAEVMMLNPRSLEQAMDLALRIEEKNRVTKAQEVCSIELTDFSYFNESPTSRLYPQVALTVGPTQLTNQTRHSQFYTPHSHSQPQPSSNHVIFKKLPQMLHHPPSQQNVTNPNRSSLNHSTQSTSRLSGDARRLSEKELQDRKSKGLCFKCDERWRVGHKCKTRELSIMIVEDEDEYDQQELPAMEAAQVSTAPP